jgi:hypothetical protein
MLLVGTDLAMPAAAHRSGFAKGKRIREAFARTTAQRLPRE